MVARLADSMNRFAACLLKAPEEADYVGSHAKDLSLTGVDLPTVRSKPPHEGMS